MSEGREVETAAPETPAALPGEGGAFWTKGKISNGLSLLVLLAGLGLSAGPAGAPAWLAAAAPWALAAGLFGFAGGITNWLAVKMLFDRVPGLYGSGVIPARFREIRATIKTLIMTHFFEEAYLRRFFDEHGSGGGPRLGEELRALLDTEEADQAIEAELERLKEGPMGMMIGMAGPEAVKALAQRFVGALIDRLAPLLEERLREAPSAGIPALRAQVDRLLEAKLEELTPAVVKEMMEHVMRRHLGWLIVWGNVFGGLIGLLSRAVAAGWGLRGVP